ncbi:MAG: PIN domain-containing protein [Candidatus Micrarchaeota archaeon]
MRLAVDTNVLISALMSKGGTFEAIVLGDLDLSVPEHSIGEIERNKGVLKERMGVSEEEFRLALDIILSHVMVVPREEYAAMEPRAKEISPDKKDFPFFALALAKRMPLWTNEKRLKKQDAVEVYGTKEVLGLLGMI